MSLSCCTSFFFFNDTATTEIYTLSLHDALPILRIRHLPHPGLRLPARRLLAPPFFGRPRCASGALAESRSTQDRKSTRLNSSHGYISYAVFCLKKKKKKTHSSQRVYLIHETRST